MTPPLIGRDEARLALLLCAIEPHLSGVLLVGGCGVGKSALLAELADVRATPEEPVVRIPLAVGEERLHDGLDFEAALHGELRVMHGLLTQARGGFVLVDGLARLDERVLSALFAAVESEAVESERASDCPGRVRIAATWHPDDGTLSGHWLDRIDLCAVLEPLTAPTVRMAIVRAHVQESMPESAYESAYESIHKSAYASAPSRLKSPSPRTCALHRASVQAARRQVMDLPLSHQVLQHAITLAEQANAEGHRGERALVLAARAYCALVGDPTVTPHHLDRIAPLVLGHRQRDGQLPPDAQSASNPPPSPDHTENPSASSPTEANPSPSDLLDTASDSFASAPPPGEGRGREAVVSAAQALRVRRLRFQKDRRIRTGAGRRTPTRTAEKRGRTLRTRAQAGDDIALAATLRAAVPWQRLRGRTEGPLRIQSADIQQREREARTAHTVIMVIDASGSMGVQARMREAKAACLGLLRDAYVQREEVAVIAFRGQTAEVVVAPTRASAVVAERLNALPTGGKTPLAAALQTTHRLIQQIRRKQPTRRLLTVLMTDGRTNVRLTDTQTPWQAVCQWAQVLREGFDGVDWIVVDTESAGFVRLGKAAELATWLGAPCWSFDDLGNRDGLAQHLIQYRDALPLR